MPAEKDHRRRCLEDLLDRRRPLRDAIAAVRALGWDSDQELAVLTRRRGVTALRARLDDLLSAEDIEA